MARTKKLLPPLPGACGMRGCMKDFSLKLDIVGRQRSVDPKFFMTENNKIDAVDYIGSSEGCISHLACLNFLADNIVIEDNIEDLHSYEKNRNTISYEWRLKKRTAVSRYSLVPSIFLSLEHFKRYLEDKNFRIKFNIFKTALSSYFPNIFNPSMIEKIYPSMIRRRCRAFLGGFLALVFAFLVGIEKFCRTWSRFGILSLY